MMRRYTAIVFLLMFAAVAGGCVTVGPDEVGVVTFNFPIPGLIDRGIQEQPLGTGTHIYVPYLMDVYIFKKSADKLEMTHRPDRGERKGRDDLRIKTSDGNDVWVDVTVDYRLDESKAPVLLLNFGPGRSFVKRMLSPTCRSVVRAVLGELTSEEFYNSALRRKKAEKTVAVLNDRLSPYGIIVDEVNIRAYRFSEEYEAEIQAKKQADQEAERNKSLTEAARREAETKKAKASGKAAAMIEKAKGEAARMKLEADAMLYQRRKEAQALEATAVAEAKGQAEINRALAGAGGRNVVALELAKALQGKKIYVLPTGTKGDVSFVDINRMLEQFTAKKVLQDASNSKVDKGKVGEGVKK